VYLMNPLNPHDEFCASILDSVGIVMKGVHVASTQST